MKRPIFYFAAGSLTVIGIISLLWSLGWFAETMLGKLFAGDSRSDFSVTKTVPSLNGEHTATLYLGMGGGAAGWCNQRIDINSKDTPFDLQKAQKGMTDMIFSASCSSNVELTWESDTRLRISYSTDENGVSTYQRLTSRDKTINITYLPK